MKILYIITKLELGGAQKVCLKLAEAFSRDHEVHVMAGRGGLLDDEARRLFGERFIVNPYMGREISPIEDIQALCFIRKYIRRYSFDVIHTHSSKAGILGRYAAYKEKTHRIIHTIHGFAFNDFRNGIVNEIYKTIERWAARYSHALVAVTSEDIAIGVKNNIGFPKQYVLIRAAADIAYFSEYKSDAGVIKKSLAIPENAKVVAQISCFKKQKNPVDFIRMAASVLRIKKDVFFVLIGDGILRKKIEMAVARYGISDNVRLLGWKDDVRPFIAACDVVTLTSLWEGLPITIVESFAMRKPVVATSVNGNKEMIVHGKNGFLYQPGDVTKAADYICTLLDNRAMQVQFGDNGYEKVAQEFSNQVMIEKTMKLYKNS